MMKMSFALPRSLTQRATHAANPASGAARASDANESGTKAVPSSSWLVSGLYLFAYVLLDWISFIEPFPPLAISPWNASIGLNFVLLPLFGWRLAPLVFCAPVLADWLVRGLPIAFHLEIPMVLCVGGASLVGNAVLRSRRLGFNPALRGMRDLGCLLGAAMLAALLAGLGYIGIAVLGGVLPVASIWSALRLYWVGDFIGIIVIAPVLLIALTRPRVINGGAEWLIQLIAIAVLLAVILFFGDEEPFRWFFLLFLPIVWMAVRQGVAGASVGLLLAQLGIILTATWFPRTAIDITALQARMLVLALTGYVVGSLVIERRKFEYELRRHQEALVRQSRIGSMGAMAAAIAHEINQPLMAAGTYGRLAIASLPEMSAEFAGLNQAVGKTVEQVERAADVIRRLRALIKLDHSGRKTSRLATMVDVALRLCRPDLERHHVVIRLDLPPTLPAVEVDALQIEQVLVNVIQNARDAMGNDGGTITITARALDAETIEVQVKDTGPGFPASMLEGPLLQFWTSKPHGIGIGLSLSRSIIESHGGRLDLAAGPVGALVRFTLPIAKGTARE